MNLYYDTFTDVAGTPLTGSPAHTSNSGATYTAHPAWSGALAKETVTGTRMRGNAATNNVFNISQAAPGADHSMTCKVYVASTGNVEDTGVLCRVTQTGNGNWYSLTINTGNVRLYRNVNGVYTQLGSLSLGEVAGIIYTLILTCLGSTVTCTVQRDSDGFYLTSGGAWQSGAASVFSITDTTVPLTPNVGLWIGAAADADNTGYQMASASLLAALALTPLQVLDVMAGFGAQGIVRGSVTDGSISGNILTCSASHQFAASDVGKDICVVNGNAAPPVFNAARNPNLNAQTVPPAPTFGCCCCGSLPQTTYYVVLTWQSYTGEGGPSAEGTVLMPAGFRLVVNQPASPGGLVTGWNVYAAAQLQVPTGITFSNGSCTGGYLQGGGTYYYKVTAVDINKPSDGSVGETTASAEASYSPTSGTTNQIQVNWNAVAGAVAYNIYRTRTGGGTNSERLLAQVPGNSTSFTDTFPDPPTGNPAPPATNTTGAGREVKQNTAPLGFPMPAQPWVEPTSGLSGGPGALVTKIKAFVSSSQVQLNYSWPFTGSTTNLVVTWGIDDSGAIQSAFNAATSGAYGRSIVFFPAAQYMTTRPLALIRPNNTGVAGLVISGAGNYQPPWWPGAFPASVTTNSVIVFAGHPSQPIIKLDGALLTCFRDMAIYGPLISYSTPITYSGAPVAGILMRVTSSGWPTDDLLIENVSVGLCGTGLMIDNLDANPDTGCGEVRCHKVSFDNCISFGMRNLNNQAVDYQFRSVNVGSNPVNPGFVAVQFDAGGCFRWEGGDVLGVGTVLRLNNQGVGPNDANITISDLRLEGNGGIQRIIVDTYNPTSAYHGVASNNTIVVENVTETTETGDNISPLFYLGPNTNVTVRSCTLYRAPLAKLSSAATYPPVFPNDTTLLLDGVSYPNGVPFSNAITGDLGSYWRSRNCRANTSGGGTGSTATPRFDESTWIGDGVVAPFRAAFFSQFLPASPGGTAGYFRPGNRQQKYIANEFPFAQMAYGLCTGVYRNADAYHGIVPVLPAVPEDEYPGWFDGNSYITMTQGSYPTIFNLPANGSFTILAWVRIPTSVVNANLASNPICGNLRTSGTGANFGGWLLDIVNNVPTFKVYNSNGSGTTTSIGLGSSVSGDTWYLLAGVEDIPNAKLWVYLFGPNNPTGLVNSIGITLATQQATSSTGACTIGQNANASPVVNANMFIDVAGLIALPLNQSALQGLYSTGVAGG